jgi:16S rRNA (guanine1516-N2)-methyltransferase
LGFVINHIVLDPQYDLLCKKWTAFLDPYKNSVDHLTIEYKSQYPIFVDNEKRKFQIDFVNDRNSYHKFKSGLSSEPLSRAVGSGKYGKKILDLSAGLGIDAVFLAQMGYQVTAVERNPFIYLALENALMNLKSNYAENIKFVHSDAQDFLDKIDGNYDVCYFDPMFPNKNKSALPKQEMVFFKNLVGADLDSSQVLMSALQSKKFKRCAVKRPLSAEPLGLNEKIKPVGQIKGKIIRYDIY